MINRTKTAVFFLTLIMSVGFPTANAQAQTAADRLQVYAGPQTALPGEIIGVTIEMTDIDGNSAQGETVYLTYISDSVPLTVSGTISNGLVSFDVEAQRRAGGMTFKALSGDLISNNASVLIVADQPAPFKLKVRPSLTTNLVELSTETINDAYGNPISDQTLVALSWIDRAGVKGSEAAQLSNGRITHKSICPSEFNAPLNIRAELKNVEIMSSDLSELCAAQKDRA